MVIQPDTAFLRDVMAAGGGDLKKCYQCATCSVVCELSPEESPFPRKQMIEAQWGLKAQLLGDPAVWLCHNCGDCTTQCPRGAHPSEVLGALRSVAIQNFAFPKFMGRLVASRKALPLLFLLPTLDLPGHRRVGAEGATHSSLGIRQCLSYSGAGGAFLYRVRFCVAGFWRGT